MNRNRRLRQNSTMRSLVRETTVLPSELIYPIFVTEGRGIKEEIPQCRECTTIPLTDFTK